jgi:6-pyruvoyltetrahydropterin/6-carboxytetrahydropterin synthase
MKGERMKISICKVFKFDAAHKLPGYQGPCQKLHGHTWSVEVEVSGREALGYQTMVLDFTRLKAIVNRAVLNDLDHGYVNDILEIPTAENLVQFIYARIKDELPREVFLERVRVWESPDSWAEIK